LRHSHDSLRCHKFLHGAEIAPGLRDLEWLDERNQPLSEEDWINSEGRALVMRRAMHLADGRIEILALLMNGSEGPLTFTLPKEFAWQVAIDSAKPDLNPTALAAPTRSVEAHACAVLIATWDATT
jgi:glycogen operon protein